MDKRINDYKNGFLLFLSFCGFFALVITNVDMIWLSLLLGAIWLLLFAIRIIYLPYTGHFKQNMIFSFIIEITILSITNHYLGSVSYLFCLSIAELCIVSFITINIIYSIAAFILYISTVTYHTFNTKVLVFFVLKESPYFAFTLIVSCLIGMMFKSYSALAKVREETEQREVQLKIAYEQLEETAVLRERNRIARQIHDTVGHTLTTAIVELEAGRLLWENEPQKAANKFKMAHTQVVKGLDDIRKSVHMLANKKISFEDEVISIVEDTMTHTGVNIRYHVDLPPFLPERYKIILSGAIREGISNGIRHGKATAFMIKLIMNDENYLVLTVSNNGINCTIENLNLGFGLTGIMKSVKEAGGQVTYKSEKEEGFEIEIKLPLVEEGKHD